MTDWAVSRDAAALHARGFSDDAVRGILGGNFLRVAGRVWAAV